MYQKNFHIIGKKKKNWYSEREKHKKIEKKNRLNITHFSSEDSDEILFNDIQ